MSAVLKDPVMLVPMSVRHLDAVLAIELLAYEFPWTRGNFVDSLAAGHVAQMLMSVPRPVASRRAPREGQENSGAAQRFLEGANGELLGYLVALPGFEEMHLLNLTVAPAQQGRGHARSMLEWLTALCAQQCARQLWLEVRESNARARGVYQRFGFAHIGMRKGYYPAPAGRREDAVVMGMEIAPTPKEGIDALE